MARVKFGDVVREVKSNIDRSNNPYEFYIAGGHMDSEEIIIHRRGRFADDDVGPAFIREFHAGQILYGSRRTYLKKVAVADFDGVTANTTFVLETKDENILCQRLLPFIMLSDRFTNWSVMMSKGSTNPYVLFSDIAGYEFDLPEMAEQKKLARVLWAVNDTVEAYKRLISATDELVRGRFAEMFDNGQYPYGMLNDLSEQWLKGQSFKKDDMTADGNIPCIHYGELFTKYGPVIDNVLSKTNRNMIRASKKGDILFPASDVTTNGLTRCSALMYNDVLLGGDIIILRLKSGFCPEYVSEAICCQKGQLLSRITGSLVRHLSVNALKTVKIPIPPYELQQQFADFVYQADKSKSSLQKALTAARNISRKIIAENLR